MRIRRVVCASAAAVFVILFGALSPVAQQRKAQTPKSLRLYVFDCGKLDIPDITPYQLKKEEMATTAMSVACFLVAHPKGTLMFDVGAVPETAFKPGGGPGTLRYATMQKPLSALLAEIGYTPADITYLSFFVDKPDYDVFGDGSVILKSAPGHSPDHQVLFLKLAKTGPVLLSGDLYHYPEERKLNRVPTTEFNADQTVKSRAAVEEFLKKTSAKLWIQHDFTANAKLKKSPAFYD